MLSSDVQIGSCSLIEFPHGIIRQYDRKQNAAERRRQITPATLWNYSLLRFLPLFRAGQRPPKVVGSCTVGSRDRRQERDTARSPLQGWALAHSSPGRSLEYNIARLLH